MMRRVHRRNKVLLAIDHYLPGYKAGGPIRSVSGMVEWLGDEFEFLILTSDRDLGDSAPYPDVDTTGWTEVGKARVRYLPPSFKRILRWRRLLLSTDYDVLYLNGFFSRLTIKTLVLRKLGLVPKKPVILAPMGEFAAAALRLKSLKKKTYISLTKLLHLYDGIIWRASSPLEAVDIAKTLGVAVPRVMVDEGSSDSSSRDSAIIVAPDLPPKEGYTLAKGVQRVPKQPGSAHIVFLSRVSPMKNLDFALSLLKRIEGDVHFDIYGPIEDTYYWDECRKIINDLPPNVRASYRGQVPPHEVPLVFARYHLFLFPTAGENFGHVILEALSAGCPVLISDQTPWRHLKSYRAGWDLPLTEIDEFVGALNKVLSMDEAMLDGMVKGALKYSRKVLSDPENVNQNRYLLHRALGAGGSYYKPSGCKT